MSQGKYNRYPILRMPLDLSQGVDEEVYRIVNSFKSGVEAKNFLCSAILYYARSPLVLSANALQEKVDELSGLIKNLDFSYTALQLEKVLAKLDEVSVGVQCGNETLSHFEVCGLKRSDTLQVQEVDPTVSLSNTMDANTHSVLSSLKEKFKV